MTGVVSHLHQIYNIDDMLLAYTHKGVVKHQKHVAVYVSFQSDRVFLASQSHLPYTQIAVVCEESDVVYVYQTKIDGIGIDNVFAVVAPCYAVADDCRGSRSGRCGRHVLLFGTAVETHASDDGAQFGVVDGLQQQVVSFVVEGYNTSRVAMIAHVSSRLASLCASHKRVETWREACSVSGVIAVVLLCYECLDAVDECVSTFRVFGQAVEASLSQHLLVVSRAVVGLVHALFNGLQSRRGELSNRVVEPPQIAVFSRLVIVLFRVASL